MSLATSSTGTIRANLRRLPVGVRAGVVALGRARRPAPAFDEEQDLAWPGHVSRSVMIACEARTGSTLLCDALRRTGSVGDPREYLSLARMSKGSLDLGVPTPTTAARLRRWPRRLLLRPRWFAFDAFEPSSLQPYLEELVRRRTSPNGVFSAKLHWAQLERAQELFGFDVATLPQPVTWIFLQRRDVVAQAISFSRAHQTGIFSKGPDWLPDTADYEDELIRGGFLRACRAVVKWEAFFRAAGIEPIRVDYEELATDYEATVGRVLTALDVGDVMVPAARLQRQADDLTVEWSARFRSTHPDLTRGIPDSTLT